MRNATPLLIDTTPSNVAWGDTIQFNVNAKEAHRWYATPEDAMPYRSIRLGNTLLNTDAHTVSDRLQDW